MKRIFCENFEIFCEFLLWIFMNFFVNFCRVFKFSLENVAFCNDKQKMRANLKLTKTATNTTPKKP